MFVVVILPQTLLTYYFLFLHEQLQKILNSRFSIFLVLIVVICTELGRRHASTNQRLSFLIQLCQCDVSPFHARDQSHLRNNMLQ